MCIRDSFIPGAAAGGAHAVLAGQDGHHHTPGGWGGGGKCGAGGAGHKAVLHRIGDAAGGPMACGDIGEPGAAGAHFGVDGIGHIAVVVLLVGAVVDGVGKDGEIHAVPLQGDGLHKAVNGSPVLVEAATGDKAVLLRGLDEHRGPCLLYTS